METKLNGLTLKILPDENPMHPRRDCEHLGTIMAWHRRYDFNDEKNEYATPQEFWESDEAKLVYAYLPVYMLDHSGQRLSVTSFNDPWDSGRLGFIYCTKEQVAKWFGNETVMEDMVKDTLIREIEDYNSYLSGNYYGFYIEGLNGELEDSCGGFAFSGDLAGLVKEMKDSVNKEYYALFDKLAKQQNNSRYM